MDMQDKIDDARNHTALSSGGLVAEDVSMANLCSHTPLQPDDSRAACLFVCLQACISLSFLEAIFINETLGYLEHLVR